MSGEYLPKNQCHKYIHNEEELTNIMAFNTVPLPILRFDNARYNSNETNEA
jgi:hypothetical protein